MGLRRGRQYRRLITIAVLAILLYILLAYEPVSVPLILKATDRTIKYDSRPTYEFNSLYRLKADDAFERYLDDQLVNLERDVRKNLPEEERSLIAKRRIWQLTTPEQGAVWAKWIYQWRDNNQDWEYSLHTSTPADLLPLFSSIPVIADAPNKYPEITNDLVRYLILWYHGGFYAEIDTWNRVSMHYCQPIVSVMENKKDVSLMVGIDFDEPYMSDKTLKKWKWARSFGFGQCSIWAPKRFDPLLRAAIVRSISHARTKKELTPKIVDWRARFKAKTDYSSEISGVGMFTDIVLESLSDGLKDDHPLRDRDAGLERRVTWKRFRALKDILWIEPDQFKEEIEEKRGVAVLPINVWGSGAQHSGSGSNNVDEACVNHVHGWMPRKQWQDKIFG